MNKEISFPKINIKLDISYTCMMSEMDPIGPHKAPSVLWGGDWRQAGEQRQAAGEALRQSSPETDDGANI